MTNEKMKTIKDSASCGFAESTDAIIPAKMMNTDAQALRYDFISAAEISEFLEIGLTQAYEICKTINKNLADRGFLTFRGKVPRKSLMEYLPH